MDIFIPKWENVSNQGMSADDLIGKIRVFKEYNKEYNVIIGDYLPNLRSFLHRYGLLESNYQSTFDILQGFTDSQQKLLKLNDLDFTEDTNFHYTPFNILVFKDHQVVGKIFFSNESQITEVQYLKENRITSIKKYDDRGMLSSQVIFRDGKEHHMEYLDSSGNWIFKYYNFNNVCSVNPQNTRGLKKLKYDTLEELKFELIETFLEKQSTADQIIISAVDNNIKYISQSSFLSQMTLSIFQERLTKFDLHEMKIIGGCSQGIIADSPQNHQKIKTILDKEHKVIQITPYDTMFELSKTQEIKDEVIFVDIRSNKHVESILINILSYIWDKISVDSHRSFKAIFRVNSEEYVSAFEIFKSILFTVFPEEMDRLILIENMEPGENFIDEEFINSSDQLSRLVKQLYDSFDFKVINTNEDLSKIFRTVRICIDLQEYPDLFTQIAGISAAIPQINNIATEYVAHKKNGWILTDMDELYPAMEYYLDVLQNWQDARISSINQINLYSGSSLVDKISKFIGKRQNG